MLSFGTHTEALNLQQRSLALAKRQNSQRDMRENHTFEGSAPKKCPLEKMSNKNFEGQDPLVDNRKAI